MGRIVYPLLGFVSQGLCWQCSALIGAMVALCGFLCAVMGRNGIHFEMIGFCGIDRGGVYFKKTQNCASLKMDCFLALVLGMPMKQGYSRKSVSSSTKTGMKTGRPQKQAVAMGMDVARRAKAATKMGKTRRRKG